MDIAFDYLDRVFDTYWDPSKYADKSEKERTMQLVRLCIRELMGILQDMNVPSVLDEYVMSDQLVAVAAIVTAVDLAMAVIMEFDYGTLRAKEEEEMWEIADAQEDDKGVDNFADAVDKLKRVVLTQTDWKGCPQALLLEKGFFATLVKGEMQYVPSMERFETMLAESKMTPKKMVPTPTGAFAKATARIDALSESERKAMYAKWAEEGRKRYGDPNKFYVDEADDFIYREDWQDGVFSAKQIMKEATYEEKRDMRKMWGPFGGEVSQSYRGRSARGMY